MRTNMRRGAQVTVLALASMAGAAARISWATPALARIQIQKNLASNPTPNGGPFQDITTPIPAQNGFAMLADYVGRQVHIGPAAAVPGLLTALQAQGYAASVATDIDRVMVSGITVDPDLGPQPAAPPPPVRGLFILTLNAYPTDAWIQDLRSRNAQDILPLGPASYLVIGDSPTMATLTALTPYARGVFPLSPQLKLAPLDPDEPSPYHHLVIYTYEETPTDSIEAYLNSVSGDAVVREPAGFNQFRYYASLTDVDLPILLDFGSVFSVATYGGTFELSSERQGVLVVQPTFDGSGHMTLPSTNPNYNAVLQAKGITNFSNSIIGILDSGFDNAAVDCAPPPNACNIHPDFRNGYTPLVIQLNTDLDDGTKYDGRTHGTMTASVIGGYVPFGTRADANGYRYTLGLADGASLVIDKWLECGSWGYQRLHHALQFGIFSGGANIVNMSWNYTQNCNYQYEDNMVDIATRDCAGHTPCAGALFTISAGNVDASNRCGTSPNYTPYVHSPGLAKNAITAGATEDYTPSTWTNQLTGIPTCPWNGQPGTQDARNIPTFSAQRNTAASPPYPIKPDLVAPGTRIVGPESRYSPWCAYNPPTPGIFCDSSPLAQPDGISYGFSAGTSFAAPAVAGASAVVRRWYRNIRGVDPTPSMTKAILINGALDIQGARLHDHDANGNPVDAGAIGHIYSDPHQGWGMLNLTRMLNSTAHAFCDECKILQTDTPPVTSWSTTVTVGNGAQPIRMTLVWTDAANTYIGDPSVRNDLTLVTYSVACQPCYYGNYFNSSTGLSIPLYTNTPPTYDLNDNVQELIIPANTYPTGQVLTVYAVEQSLPADGVVPGGTGHRQNFSLYVDNAH